VASVHAAAVMREEAKLTLGNFLRLRSEIFAFVASEIFALAAADGTRFFDLNDFSDSFIAQRFCGGANTVQFVMQLVQHLSQLQIQMDVVSGSIGNWVNRRTHSPRATEIPCLR